MNNKITDTHISILVPISRYQYTDMDIGASLNTIEWIDIANTEYRYTAIRIPVYRYF
jgi:hypothetical protein